VARTKKRKIHAVLGWGNLKERKRLQDIGIYERIILKRILQYWMEKVYWVFLTLSRNKRRAAVNTAMNVCVT